MPRDDEGSDQHQHADGDDRRDRTGTEPTGQRKTADRSEHGQVLEKILQGHRPAAADAAMADLLQSGVDRHHKQSAADADGDQAQPCPPQRIDQAEDQDAGTHGIGGQARAPQAFDGNKFRHHGGADHGTDGQEHREHGHVRGFVEQQHRRHPRHQDHAQHRPGTPEQRGAEHGETRAIGFEQPAHHAHEVANADRFAAVGRGNRRQPEGDHQRNRIAGHDHAERQRDRLVGHDTADKTAEHDGGDGRTLDQAVGAHQAIVSDQLRQDAELGRPVDSGTDADEPIGQQRINGQQQQPGTERLQGVADHQHLRFGAAIGKRPDPGREQHEGDQESTLQRRDVPVTLCTLTHHGDGREQDGIVGEGRQELRQHQHIDGAVHAPASRSAVAWAVA